MAKREDEFGEYMMAGAAPVPVFGSWPEIKRPEVRLARPGTLVAIAGLLIGLAVGFLATWPTSTLVYPGTQVASWMGDPAKVLQTTNGTPVTLQATRPVVTTGPATALQNTLNTQLTSFSQQQPGYMDTVNGQFLQGTQNITPR